MNDSINDTLSLPQRTRLVQPKRRQPFAFDHSANLNGHNTTPLIAQTPNSTITTAAVRPGQTHDLRWLNGAKRQLISGP